MFSSIFLKDSLDEGLPPPGRSKEFGLNSSSSSFLLGSHGGFGPEGPDAGLEGFDDPLAMTALVAASALEVTGPRPDRTSTGELLESDNSDMGASRPSSAFLAEEFHFESPLPFRHVSDNDNSRTEPGSGLAGNDGSDDTGSTATVPVSEQYHQPLNHGTGSRNEQPPAERPPTPPAKKKSRPATRASTAAAASVNNKGKSKAGVTAAAASMALESLETLSKNQPAANNARPKARARGSASRALEPRFQAFAGHPRIADAHARLQELRVAVHNVVDEQAQLGVPLSRPLAGGGTEPVRSADEAAELPAVQSLRETVLSLMSDLSDVVAECRRVQQTFLLSPPDLYRVGVVERDAFGLERQLAVLQKELSLMVTHPDRLPPPCVELIVQKQPFPKTLMQNRVVEEDCVVELLRGAKTAVAGSSSVTAQMLVEFQPKKKSELDVANGTMPLNCTTGLARFTKLKFPHGTRKTAATLKFQCTVKCADLGHDQGGRVRRETGAASRRRQQNQPFVELYVESQPTAPFVVKTNEKQWAESEAMLLRRQVFHGRQAVPWAQFINVMHSHHLLSTRQQLHEPARALCMEELEFLRHQFGVPEEAAAYAATAAPVTSSASSRASPAAAVSQALFEQAWAWLGPIEHKLRHRRHLSALWGTGMIAGFLTRRDAEQALDQQGVPGAFLVRFSERFAGEFVISYLTNSLAAKHYLVRPDEANTPSDTLPDFIRSHSDALRLLLRVVPADGRAAAAPLGSRAFELIPVGPILTKFCKPEVESTPWGYEETVAQNLDKM